MSQLSGALLLVRYFIGADRWFPLSGKVLLGGREGGGLFGVWFLFGGGGGGGGGGVGVWGGGGGEGVFFFLWGGGFF